MADVARLASRSRQASLIHDASPPSTGLQRAHRGPGGYCRPSGNQGTTGRPATTLSTMAKIYEGPGSKPDEPREGLLPHGGIYTVNLQGPSP